MKNCPLCHTSNDDDRELCSACGALLEGSIYENIKKRNIMKKTEETNVHIAVKHTKKTD